MSSIQAAGKRPQAHTQIQFIVYVDFSAASGGGTQKATYSKLTIMKVF